MMRGKRKRGRPKKQPTDHPVASTLTTQHDTAGPPTEFPPAPSAAETFPFVSVADISKDLPMYALVLKRSPDVGVNIGEIDTMQFELEKLLVIAARRRGGLETELRALSIKQEVDRGFDDSRTAEASVQLPPSQDHAVSGEAVPVNVGRQKRKIVAPKWKQIDKPVGKKGKKKKLAELDVSNEVDLSKVKVEPGIESLGIHAEPPESVPESVVTGIESILIPPLLQLGSNELQTTDLPPLQIDSCFSDAVPMESEESQVPTYEVLNADQVKMEENNTPSEDDFAPSQESAVGTNAVPPSETRVKPNRWTRSMRKGHSFDYKSKYWRSVNVYCRELTPRDLDVLQEIEAKTGVDDDIDVRHMFHKHYCQSWAEVDSTEDRECSAGVAPPSGKRKLVRTTLELTPDVTRLLKKGEVECKKVQPSTSEQDSPLYRRLLSSISAHKIPDGPLLVDDSMDLETRLRIRLTNAGILGAEAMPNGKPDEITSYMNQVKHELKMATAQRTIALGRLRVSAEREMARVELRKKLLVVNKELEKMYFNIQAAKRGGGNKLVSKKDMDKGKRLMEERKGLVEELRRKTEACDAARYSNPFEPQPEFEPGV